MSSLEYFIRQQILILGNVRWPKHYPISYYQLEVAVAAQVWEMHNRADLLILTNVCYHSWTTQYITRQNRLQFISDPSQSAGRKNSYLNFSDKKTGALGDEATFPHVVNQHCLPWLCPCSANCWLCPCLGIHFLLVHTITRGAKDVLKLSKLDLDSSENISYPI